MYHRVLSQEPDIFLGILVKKKYWKGMKSIASSNGLERQFPLVGTRESLLIVAVKTQRLDDWYQGIVWRLLQFRFLLPNSLNHSNIQLIRNLNGPFISVRELGHTPCMVMRLLPISLCSDNNFLSSDVLQKLLPASHLFYYKIFHAKCHI